jgi:23S rRNA (guanosine2251-2'-O)-methyltransferase
VIIYGINPVLEALRGGRVREVRVVARAGERHQQIVAQAREAGVPTRTITAQEIERESKGGVHQGVVATVDAGPEYSVEELVRSADGPALIVVLDGIEDPHNVGAILRTADAAGAHGVIIQSRRSAALAGGAAKASAGALSHVRIAEVVNIARAIEELKQAWRVERGPGWRGDHHV